MSVRLPERLSSYFNAVLLCFNISTFYWFTVVKDFFFKGLFFFYEPLSRVISQMQSRLGKM